MEDMEVAQHYLEEWAWGSTFDPESDWSLFQEHSTFSHKEFCEFILCVGDEGERDIELYQKQGFSELILDLCRSAKEKGYKYICFFGG